MTDNQMDYFLGRTIKEIKGEEGDEEMVFRFTDGTGFRFYHLQDCCEWVSINEIHGDLNDLIDSPVLQAEEVIHHAENPEGVTVPEYQDSFTWTFYKFATNKGSVTVRWYGDSNGYYSESVDMQVLTN